MLRKNKPDKPWFMEWVTNRWLKNPRNAEKRRLNQERLRKAKAAAEQRRKRQDDQQEEESN